MRRLGPYELIRRLDDGALSERWLAQRAGPRGPATCSVELLHGRALAIPEIRARVFDEARRLSALRHPNIVPVVELVELENTWVVVADAGEGMTLAEFLACVHGQGQRMTYPLVAYVIGELLRALAHAHSLPLIHAAISPRDLMLSSAGAVSLAGFGLSLIGVELSRAPAAMRYMPPEQLTGGRGPSLDLFAVGGILHELLDGCEFRSQAVDEAVLYAAIRDGQIAPLGPQHADYPTPLESLRAGLLAPRLEFRIPSARDGLALLGEWPGYHDASGDLAGLVRTFLGLAPTNSLAEASATVIIDQSKLAVVPEFVEPPPPPLFDGLPPSDPGDPAQQERTPITTIALVAGLGVLGLSFLIVGLGFALGWWGPKARSEPELAATEPPPIVEPEPVEPEPTPSLVGAEPTPEIDPNAKPTIVGPGEALPGAEVTPVINPKPPSNGGTDTTDGTSSDGGKSSGIRKGVSVTFVERHYARLQVKVGSREIEFDGKKTFSFSPGTYALSLREKGQTTWRAAGKIVIQAGKRYEVTLLDPPLAMVKPL